MSQITTAVGRSCFVCEDTITAEDDFLHVLQGLDDAPVHRTCWEGRTAEWSARIGVKVVSE